MEKSKVPMTNGIPICLVCTVATKRRYQGSQRNLMYSIPTYDEEGNVVNPPSSTDHYQCLACESYYAVEGNDYFGYEYVK